MIFHRCYLAHNALNTFRGAVAHNKPAHNAEVWLCLESGVVLTKQDVSREENGERPWSKCLNYCTHMSNLSEFYVYFFDKVEIKEASELLPTPIENEQIKEELPLVEKKARKKKDDVTGQG